MKPTTKNRRRLIIAGVVAGTIAVPAVTAIAAGAPDQGTPISALPKISSKIADSAVAELVGPNARSWPAAGGVTRIEGKGQVCSVAPDRILACGPAQGLGNAPVVDVTITEGGDLAVSLLSDTSVQNIAVTDVKGQIQGVGLSAGIGSVSLPHGNFKLAWKTSDGKAHTDAVPVDTMFSPVGQTPAR